MTQGETIRQLRKAAGLTQAQLGAKMGAAASLISQYETDKRSLGLNMLRRLSKALGISPTELFGRLCEDD